MTLRDPKRDVPPFLETLDRDALHRIADPGSGWDWMRYDGECRCLLGHAFDVRPGMTRIAFTALSRVAESAYMDYAAEHGNKAAGRLMASLATRELVRRDAQALVAELDFAASTLAEDPDRAPLGQSDR